MIDATDFCFQTALVWIRASIHEAEKHHGPGNAAGAEMAKALALAENATRELEALERHRAEIRAGITVVTSEVQA